MSRLVSAIRSFSATQQARASQDIIQSLYLAELRAYKPLKTTAKVDLPETFALPTPPAPPAFDKTAITAKAEEALAKASAWPALVDPIDDPENYNGIRSHSKHFTDEWNFTSDVDDGSWFPRRTKEHHYHD